MSTLLIENINYKTLPKENLTLLPSNVTEIHIVNSKYDKIIVIGEDWVNLERIIIERCSYCEVEISLPIRSNLSEIVIAHSNYMKIKSISCESNSFQSISFDNDKYLYFKGKFFTGNSIKEIRFLDCPNCELNIEGQLIGCERFHVINCSHGQIKFDRINLPSLVELGIYNSAYFTFKKSSIVLPNLLNIHLFNSSYSSLPDPRIYPRIQEITIINSDYLGLPDSLPKHLIQKPKGVPNEMQQIPINNPDMSLGRQPMKSAQNEINYCPFCGGKIQSTFKICPQCNSPLEFD